MEVSEYSVSHVRACVYAHMYKCLINVNSRELSR